MTDFDPFERRLAAALRSDADLGVNPFEPGSIARAAIAGAMRPASRFPWTLSTRGRRVRLAAAAVIAVVVVVGAGFFLFQRGQPAVVGGPSPTPSSITRPSESASPSMVPSPSVSSVRAPSWTVTGDMIGARWGGTAVLLQGGKVLVFGGNAAPWPPDVELYDPRTATWTATGSMITPRVGGFTATRLVDGRVLVTGGQGEHGYQASAELYDPSTGSWTATRKMHTARSGHTATLLPDGKVLVAGGEYDQPFSVASAELYDPSARSWTVTGSMSTSRIDHIATLLNDGNVLVAGGTNEDDTTPSYGPLSSAELYDPATGKWTATRKMTRARSGPTGTLLGDGRVLVVGGTGKDGRVSSAEIYDPTAGSWTATGSLSAPIVGYTATLLSDGRVLVAGGQVNADVCAPASVSAKLYDPRTGTWGATSDMIEGRYWHTATLLPDGRVLAASGRHSGRGGEPCGPGLDLQSSAELYDPGSGQ